jgi:hypothetical protein
VNGDLEASLMAIRKLGWTLVFLCGGVIAAAGQGFTTRDTRDAPARNRTSGLERMIRLANAWDANNDQVYTCDEWKKFVTDIFNKADRNRDGFVDAQEFKAIQDATAQFKDAEFGYFDDNRDGRVSRAEFVDKPNPFFLQFDRNRDCKVTLEEIMDTAAPHATESPRPGSPGGMR